MSALDAMYAALRTTAGGWATEATRRRALTATDPAAGEGGLTANRRIAILRPHPNRSRTMTTTTTTPTPLTDADLDFLNGSWFDLERKAAAEIRALREENALYRMEGDQLRATRDDLLTALKGTEAALSCWLAADDCDHSVGICFCEDKRTRDAARACIARAEGRAE